MFCSCLQLQVTYWHLFNDPRYLIKKNPLGGMFNYIQPYQFTCQSPVNQFVINRRIRPGAMLIMTQFFTPNHPSFRPGLHRVPVNLDLVTLWLSASQRRMYVAQSKILRDIIKPNILHTQIKKPAQYKKKKVLRPKVFRFHFHFFLSPFLRPKQNKTKTVQALKSSNIVPNPRNPKTKSSTYIYKTCTNTEKQNLSWAWSFPTSQFVCF